METARTQPTRDHGGHPGWADLQEQRKRSGGAPGEREPAQCAGDDDEAFMRGVDTLRESADRLQARVDALDDEHKTS